MRRLARDFGLLASGELVARLAGLVTVVVLARRLEPDGFGLVTLGTTLILWFALIGEAGTEALTTRDVAREPERFRAIVAPVLGLRLSLAGAGVILYALTAALLGPGADATAMLLFALVLPALALNLRLMVLGVGGSSAVAAGNALSQAAFLGAVLAFVDGPDDLIAVPLAQLASEAIYAAVVMGAVGRRHGVPRPRIDIAAWRRILHGSLPMLAQNGARTLLYSFDLVLIAAVLGAASTAIYGAAYKPVLFLSGIAGLFSGAYLAAYSRATAAERATLSSHAVRAVLAVTVPAAALLAAAAPWLVDAVFGSAYADAALVLAILAWSLPLLTLAVPYGTVLLADDRQRVLMRHNILAAAVNVAANAVVVPLAGLTGAALVTVASFALVLVLNYRASVAHRLAPPVSALLRPPRPPAARRASPLRSGSR